MGNYMYSFKDYLAVDYTQTGDELLALKAKRRKSDDTTGVIGEDDVDEALTNMQRQKAKQTFRKNKAKIELGKKKAAKKLATPDQLQKRAEKQARNVLIKKITKDKDKSDLSFAQRTSIEKQLEKKKAAIKKIAKKLLPKLRIADREKKAAAKAGGAD
jgi:hypothetical protein